VLEYAIKCAERFTPSDVVVYARKEYGLESDNRRVHDALQRLLKRGPLIKKIDPGWYELVNRNLTLKDLETVCSRAKQRLLARAKQAEGKEDVWKPRKRVIDPVVRFHFSSGSAGSVVDLHSKLAFIHAASGEALKCVERKYRGVLSAYLIRKNRRVARELAGRVVDCVVGAHSRYGGGRGKELKPLIVLEGRRFREIGVDLVLGVTEAPKLYAKIYTDENPYKARKRAS
jgi:GTP1/Obg family GTP-binding protein